jgi:hypothetical protein
MSTPIMNPPPGDDDDPTEGRGVIAWTIVLVLLAALVATYCTVRRG